MKKPLSGILSSLIVLSEEVVTRPQSALQSPHVQGRVANLGVEVREADQRIYEGEPTTAAAVVMVTALEQFLTHRGQDLGAHWLSVAGVMLPLLRAETFKAISNEREARLTP